MDEPLPVHRHARVIRTRPSNIYPSSDDNYPPYNRLFSFRQWLEEYQPQGTVLVLDPDVIFRNPLNIEAPPSGPIGQDWLDFRVNDQLISAIQNLSDVRVDSMQPVTWPAFIDCRDLETLIPRWIEITAGIRDQLGLWESDMFAFTVAAAELGLKFSLETNTAWTPWPNEKVNNASIVHYCQKIYDNLGKELWWKQTYEPWHRVDLYGKTKEAYCDDLLRLVDEHARIRQYEQHIQTEDTIFVAIASYCEPELISTIESCLRKARRPENLRFGICLQYDESDEMTSSHCLDAYSQDTRFRYVKYPYVESKGGCWARNLAQQLYDQERYTLQLDAHSQMLESWDTILIEMLKDLPSEKPLITAFPPLYYFENNMMVYQHIDDLTQVNTAIAKRWNEDGSLQHSQVLESTNNIFPRRTRFLSGAFVFTFGRWNQEVTQDPEHFYTGEEFALTIRSFTHGYDLFDPNQITIWHRLHPAPNRKFWNDNSSEKVHELHCKALQRLRWLYEGDPDNQLGRYGSGTTRSLEEFYLYAGLNCKSYSIHPDAADGTPPDPATLEDYQTSEAFMNTVQTDTIDLSILVKGMAPLELFCEVGNPIIRLLFQSLFDKQSDPDSVIYLNTGEHGEHVTRFKKSSLVAIEAEPPMSEEFIADLLSADPVPEDSPATNRLDFTFGDDWKYWIWHNIHQRGCSRDIVFKELILNDFPWEAVKQELNYEPDIPLEQIRSISEQARPNKDKLLIPGVQSLSDKIEIYSVSNFLTQAECDHLCSQIESRKQPSTTADEDLTPKVRTSQTCFFSKDDKECSLANEVTIRVAKLLGLNSSYGEALQGHIYYPGEEYKAHADFFNPGTEQFEQFANDELGGQRTWSVLIYLNDVKDGGATVFPDANLSVQPRRGKAVFWNNLLPSGNPNMPTLHSARPLGSGRKVVLSQWFRSIGQGEAIQRDLQEYIPAYTTSGVEKAAIPGRLFADLRGLVDPSTRQEARNESGVPVFNSSGNIPSQMIDIPEPLMCEIYDQLKPICEQWSGRKLIPSAIYGIRRYARGTSLDMHRDRPKTHIISAILNIAQKVDEEWPLEIEDHSYRLHKIKLNPGEMLLYEGARLPHGRPTPLNGDFYSNVFVHFRPVDYVVPESIA